MKCFICDDLAQSKIAHYGRHISGAAWKYYCRVHYEEEIADIQKQGDEQ